MLKQVQHFFAAAAMTIGLSASQQPSQAQTPPNLDVSEGAQTISDRVIYITGTLDHKAGDEILEQLDALNAESNEPITIRINSAGGLSSVASAIITSVRRETFQSPIRTECIGNTSSAASVILILAADRGQRYASELCRIAIHQPGRSIQDGELGELQNAMSGAELIWEGRVKDLAAATALSEDQLRALLSDGQELYLSAEEAQNMGLIEHIIRLRSYDGDQDIDTLPASVCARLSYPHPNLCPDD